MGSTRRGKPKEKATSTVVGGFKTQSSSYRAGEDQPMPHCNGLSVLEIGGHQRGERGNHANVKMQPWGRFKGRGGTCPIQSSNGRSAHATP